ncbi:MAG: lamin tail domain-containing protein [Oscillospiraceae bacterium]|jgi:hypothetical protein|nr:lamin tail domain-containing protein [Oscillospiraceae bacterium]
MSPAPARPPRRRADRGPVSGHAILNAALFAALVVALAFVIAASFPALRASLNIDGLLGKLPPVPAVLASTVRVTEIMPSNQRTLPDGTGAFNDWIELTNIGGEAVSLSGYTLSDRDSQPKFTFPNITMEPGAIVIVFASGVESLQLDKPLHAAMKLSASGETLYLSDDSGQLVESITIPPTQPDESYARSGSRWIKTDSPTPGYENTQAGRDAFVASMTQPNDGLRLNEIMASNGVTLADGDGDYPDWVELFNASPQPIDLSRRALSDDPAKPVKWRFPDGAVIEPYGVYLVFASGKAGTGAAIPHASFKLRADHGVVILSDLAGNIIDSTEYDNLPTDAVWARRGDEQWETTAAPSPGAINP